VLHGYVIVSIDSVSQADWFRIVLVGLSFQRLGQSLQQQLPANELKTTRALLKTTVGSRG
jgi:hypothetical protein